MKALEARNMLADYTGNELYRKALELHQRETDCMK